MSLGLQATKRRIQSVSSTKKITKAMELVATAKLKALKDKMQENMSYTASMIDIANDVFSSIEDCDSVFVKGNKSNKTLFVIVTSNLGLCASYNYEIFKVVDSLVNKDDKVIMIGTKGYTHYNNLLNDIDDRFVDILAHINYQDIELLCNEIIAMYSKGEIGKIKLIYTKYVNSLTFTPETLQLLPVNMNKQKITKKYTIMEPTPLDIIDALLPMYVKSVVYGKLIESVVSEQASRRTAMETATDNSQEIIDKLQILYNKERQAAITQEITEVVGGSLNK